MNRYIFAPSARDDLDEIWDYIGIEQQSPAAADRVIYEFIETFKLLAEQPLMAEKCQQFEHLVPELRHFPVGNYIMYYRPMENGVQIGHIAHGAMNQEALFRQWLASGDLP
jgi:toxin ParE1/3/4